jgi:Carboxylesterase family
VGLRVRVFTPRLSQYAILESEPFGLPFRTLSTWSGITTQYVSNAGCGGAWNVDECLKGLSASVLLAAQAQSEKDVLADASRLLDLFLPWTPTVGTPEVPEQPINAWVAGNMLDIPIIIGQPHRHGFPVVHHVDVVCDAVCCARRRHGGG